MNNKKAGKGADTMKVLYFVLFILALIFTVTDARAMPLRLPPQANLIIPVASGCGLGVHRGPYDGCYPIYGVGYPSSYYTGFVSRGVCGGRGTHLACNVYGTCWVACN
ncbi:MAG TPA: hypothetical protein VEC94_06900 [Pseudolabrys sp.]|nr:hypothetical protein [Pseudolabrys sp.]